MASIAQEGGFRMPFDRAALLEPLALPDPCGPALNEHPLYDEFRAFANAQQRPDWARHLDRALRLAQDCRDLRAWVWLTRSSLCAEGVHGLAAGLQLIAEGLEHYWDVLPPQHANENDPAERFMMRLSTLTQLGATHYACSLDDLRRFGRNYTDLQADLADAIARAEPGPVTRDAALAARDASDRICQAFTRGFGPGHDPLVSFDMIRTRLEPLAASMAAEPVAEVVAEPVQVPRPALGPVSSRGDVVRALDLVLAYYEMHEPSSPVPLLIARAKRLVPLSFMDALKELAPGGLKELQVIAGQASEQK